MLGEDSGGGGKNCITVIHGAEAMEAGRRMQVVTYLHTRFHDLVVRSDHWRLLLS
jgi:hypothetical protein